MNQSQQIQAQTRLIEVKINGFTYYADDVKNLLYTDKKQTNYTEYKFLTPNERTQLRNCIDYPKQNG